MPSIILFHKPKGVVVTRDDERGSKTVYDILPDWFKTDGWMPVGRLDKDSRGLLLFVRDGKLLERLTRPGSCVKTYEVIVRGHLQDSQVSQLLCGIRTGEEILKAVSVKIVGYVGPKTKLLIDLDEGKNRHIRRMLGALRDERAKTPLKVLELKRVKFASLSLDIPSGQWRHLTETEDDSLQVISK